MYYTYILTNYKKSVLYTGVSDDLLNRLIIHYSKRGTLDSFTSKYSCFYLVWYDSFPTMNEAIQMEKYLKGKKRVCKNKLITEFNPEWKFLNEEILDEWPPDQELLKAVRDQLG